MFCFVHFSLIRFLFQLQAFNAELIHINEDDEVIYEDMGSEKGDDEDEDERELNLESDKAWDTDIEDEGNITHNGIQTAEL